MRSQNEPKIRYGIFICRAQPFHLGHQAAINEILIDGLLPIIVLSSSQEDRDLIRNPLSYEQRKLLVQKIYKDSEVLIVKGTDNVSTDVWYTNLLKTLPKPKYCTLYYFNKEQDRYTFEYNGKIFINTFYTEIFKYHNFSTKELLFPFRSDFVVNASDIRNNLERNKYFLDGRVLKLLRTFNLI